MPETRVEARLKAVSAVTDLVGARIFPVRRYQGRSTSLTGLPAVTYQRVGTTPVGSSTGTTNVAWAMFQINCIAASYEAAKGLADVVRAALWGWIDLINPPNIDRCQWQGESDAPEPVPGGQSEGDYAIMQDFLIQYKLN